MDSLRDSVPPPAKECPTAEGDDYDTPARIPGWGPRFNQCIDTSRKRSIQILSENQGYLVANFSFRNQFWIAQFPQLEGSIEEVVFQIEHFPPEAIAAHTQLRFRMKDDKVLQLTHQVQPSTREIVPIKEFVYSVEYMGALINGKEEPYDVRKKAAFGFYGLAFRFVALQDKIEHMVNKEHHKVEQFRLILSDAEKQNLLKTAITTSHKVQFRKMYSLAHRNCTTELFAALDQSVNYSSRGIWLKLPVHSTPTTLLPVWAQWHLTYRGLINHASRLKDLGEEFPAPPAN